MFLALVPRPRVPVAGIHTALYGYFPEIDRGAPRPYIWRHHDDRRVAMLSAVAPAYRHGRVEILPGVAYRMTAHLRTTRHVGPERREVAITDPKDIQAWVVKHWGLHGGEVRYVTAERAVTHRFNKSRSTTVTVTASHVDALVIIRDVEAATRFIVAGGPGTGKVYGFGMWWVDEAMAPLAARLTEAEMAA